MQHRTSNFHPKKMIMIIHCILTGFLLPVRSNLVLVGPARQISFPLLLLPLWGCPASPLLPFLFYKTAHHAVLIIHPTSPESKLLTANPSHHVPDSKPPDQGTHARNECPGAAAQGYLEVTVTHFPHHPLLNCLLEPQKHV